MINEEKILSMLDIIAAQVTSLTETSVTKAELRGVKNEVQSIKDSMVTKDEFRSFKEQVDGRFDKLEVKNSAAHEAILAKIDKQAELSDAKLNVLNQRLFYQEGELRTLKKQEVL